MELVRRNCEALARDLLGFSPVLIIEGARQVGKSTLAHKLVGEHAQILSLDDPPVREAAVADPNGFVERLDAATVVIDEVQRAPELTLSIKASVDRDRTPGRFILTGSSTLLRVRGLSDSLAGRAMRLTLFGLSRGEIGAVNDDFVASIVRRDAAPPEQLTRSDYASLIVTGGYPEIAAASDRIRDRWIDSYLENIVRRDLPDLRRGVEPARAFSLLRVIAGRQAAELIKARLASAVDIPATTITSYLDLLTDVGLVGAIPSWTPNLAKREVGRSKVLVLDSAVASRLSGLTAEQLASPEYSEAFGHLLEGFVAAEILKQQTWTSEDFRLYHFRDRDGLEVDFILELTGGRCVAIEVKATSTPRAAHFKPIRRLQEKIGDRLLAGVVLHTGRDTLSFGDRLTASPVSALWAGQPVAERT